MGDLLMPLSRWLRHVANPTVTELWLRLGRSRQMGAKDLLESGEALKSS